MREWLVMLLIAGCSKDVEALADAKREIAQVQVNKVAFDWYPRWALKATDALCPTSLDDLATAVQERDGTKDPWGNPLDFTCEPTGSIRVTSRGEDGKAGTADDIASKAKAK